MMLKKGVTQFVSFNNQVSEDEERQKKDGPGFFMPVYPLTLGGQNNDVTLSRRSFPVECPQSITIA